MAVEKLQSELSHLYSETLQRLNQDMLGMQNHVLTTLKQLEEQSSVLTKQLSERARRPPKRERSEAVLPRASEAATLGSFGMWLSEPSMAIHVGGVQLHIHTSLLRTIPYFEGLLRGDWLDSAQPQVDLPCSAAEFCLLLQRLYTGEFLGTPALPVKDGAAAVRLAVTAARLLIDTSIPELPRVLRASITTEEDWKVAVAAAGALPGALKEIFKNSSTPMPAGDFQAMVEASKTPNAQAAAQDALATQNGQEVAAVAKNLLAKARVEADVNWAFRIAQEHLDCHEATDVFKAVPTVRHSLACCEKSTPKLRGAHEAFLRHLHRCAEKGCLVIALPLGFELPHQASKHKFLNSLGRTVTCSVTQVNPLALNASSRTALAAALTASRKELPSAAECLSRMPAAQLAKVLGEEVLQALAQYVEGPLAALAASPIDAGCWVTAERLESLPLSLRPTLARSLESVLCDLAPEVSAKILDWLLHEKR